MSRGGRQNRYVHGEWNFICDICGRKLKSSEARKTWDGFIVCPDDFDPKHEQIEITGIKDDQSVPWTRTESTDTYIDVVAEGTNTTSESLKLIDSSATFVTDGVIPGNTVFNYDYNTSPSSSSVRTVVASVDSETELTLAAHIFKSTSQRYRIRNLGEAAPEIVVVLDNFERADETLTASANWLAPLRVSGFQFAVDPAIVGGVVANPNPAGGPVSAYWASQFNADQQVVITVGDDLTGAEGLALYLRTHNPGETNRDGFSCFVTETLWGIYRHDDGIFADNQFVLLGSVAAPLSIVAGDQLKAVAQGTTISLSHKPVGSDVWTEYVSVTSANYNTAGYAGFHIIFTATIADFDGTNL